MLKKIMLLVLSILIVSCGGESQTVTEEVEVTRIVEVVSEVEVTREIEVEVTREIEVTRIVVATPSPEPEPTEAPPPEIEASSFLTGTHDISSLPTSTEEGVSVVIAGELSDFYAMPVVFFNNSGMTVARITASATASSADGQLLKTADLSDWGPNVVPNGGFAIGRILFGPDADLPEDVVIEFDADARDAEDNDFENIRDLPIIEHNLVNGSIVGRFENIYDEEIDLMSVAYACFDTDGVLVGGGESFVDKDTAAAGDIVPFEVELFSNEDNCATYLITASGFGDF